MALKGTYKHYTYFPSETETVEVVVTYPDDLPEEDPNYDKRGTQETETAPVSMESFEEFENAYVTIAFVNYYKYWVKDGKNLIDLCYHVHSSQESKENGDECIFEEWITGSYVQVSEDDDVRKLAYQILKEQKGMELLNDA